MNWETVYETYPVNRELIWLNNCGITPAGNHIVESVSRFLEEYSKKGIWTETTSYGELQEEIKTILASLLHCRPDELSLIHNTAEGMNFISRGLRLNQGDEIVLLENEYPSNVYPWLHWKEKGIKIDTVPMEMSPAAFLEKFDRLLSWRTRAVAISAVHWCTGMPLPLEEVGEICRGKGIDLVVDGAQGVGMQPMDVKRTGISYMAFSAWKWLMGPLGLGVMYVAREKLEELRPVFMGSESVVRPQEYLPYKSRLKPDADRFTFSTPSLDDWVYFRAALKFLDEIGFEKARERIFELTAHLNRGLRRMGFQVLSDRFPDHPTGITVFERPGVLSEDILAHLRKNRIVAAERLGRVRLSPHIYISPEQLDRVMDVLSET